MKTGLITVLLVIVSIQVLAQKNFAHKNYETAKLYNTARALYFEGQYEDAIIYLNKALTIEPDFGKAYVARGASNYRQGRSQEAIFDCRKALALNVDETWGIYNNLALAEIDLGLYEEALGHANIAIKQGGNYADGYNTRGIAKKNIGDFNGAIDDYTKAIRIEPHQDFYFNRGWVYLQKNFLIQAIADYDTVLMIDPADAGGLYQRGYANFQQKRYNEAISDYDAALEIDRNVGTLTNYAQEARNFSEGNFSENVLFFWKEPEMKLGIEFYPYSGSQAKKISAVVLSAFPLQEKNLVLYVDGQPITGSKASVGIIQNTVIERQYSYTFETTVQLKRGDNSFQLTYGSKSSPALIVRYMPHQLSLYIVSIGTGSGLEYSEKDAKDFSEIFTSQEGKGKIFLNRHSEVLIGDHATRDGILDKIEALRNSGYSENDVLLLFISTHGIVRDDELFLQSSDYSDANWHRKSVNFRYDILEPLKELPCKKIVFLDACRSETGMPGAKSLSSSDVEKSIDKIINAESDFVILSSSAKNELSWEDVTWTNGAFTYAIKEALKYGYADRQYGDANNLTSLKELSRYLEKRVPQLTNKVKRAVQTPKIYGNGDIDIYITN